MNSQCPWLLARAMKIDSFRFISVFNEKSTSIVATHADVQSLLEQIQCEHDTSVRLEKDLEHEKSVLNERLEVGRLTLLTVDRHEK